jgi:hypothetical protein
MPIDNKGTIVDISAFSGRRSSKSTHMKKADSGHFNRHTCRAMRAMGVP